MRCATTRTRSVIAPVTLLLVMLAAPGCKLLWGDAPLPPEGSGGPRGHIGGVPAALDALFTAKTLHLDMERDTGASQPRMRVELWLDAEDRLRADVYRPGTSQISSTYIAESESELTEYRWSDESVGDAPFDAAYFRRGLRAPGVEPVTMGVDKVSGADLYRFPVQRAYGARGSARRTYVTDIIYGLKGGKLAFYVIYGSPGASKSGGPVTAARYDVTVCETDLPSDDTVFDPPF